MIFVFSHLYIDNLTRNIASKKVIDIVPKIRYYNLYMEGGGQMETARKLKYYTIDDIYALPEGERAELIDGQIYYMAPLNRRHQDIIFSLSRKIADYIEAKNGVCKVYLAPFAVFLNEYDRNYVEPDISIICDSNKLNDKGCNGAPDWIIEIVSPSSRKMDYYNKLFKYRTAGVREYWVVDPDRKIVTVYEFEHDNMEEYSFDEDVPVGIYEGFSIKVQ
jgi:Uma2 family endonuclease